MIRQAFMKIIRKKSREIHGWTPDSGQALVEYVLVVAFIAVAMMGVLNIWKLPLAKYLTSLAQVIAQPR
jgi:Flp pilus assembly pilin Flp